MTKEELEVLNLLTEAWNKFLALETLHDWDKREFMYNMHSLQNIVLARAGLRDMMDN